jgi:hypothetical protein
VQDEIFGTGACGINCLTCGLATSGRCSPCGPGNGPQAQKKLVAQLEIIGGYCPILKCAQDRRLAFCMRDCPDFPCDNFEAGPYPYGNGFLQMQKRRRQAMGIPPRD